MNIENSEAIIAQIPMSMSAREYIREKNWHFKDAELGTLICNSSICLEEETTLLKQLLILTDDSTLAGQIREHLAWEDSLTTSIAKTGVKIVFLVSTDGEADVRGCFSKLDTAIQFGKKDCEVKFVVEKWASDSEKCLATVGYAKNGTVTWRRTSEVVPPIDDWDISRFEHRFFIAPNPFEQGDLVRRIDGTKLGVVRTSRWLWNKDNERFLNSPHNDASDIQIVVEFLDEGDLYHDHVSPLLLERVVTWDNKDEWGLMEYVAMTMRGEGSIEELQYFFERYRNWIKAKEIEERGHGLECLHHLCKPR